MLNSIVNIDDKIMYGFYKQSADKIIQILEKVREERKNSSRRWIWELMQNAKDVKNTFGKVKIHIELTEDHLLFAHNGDPFTEENLISLIQQVSSKASDNSDENVTGKFGTGFISTHLLSDIIDVIGCLKRDSGVHQRFKMKLDRRGEKSEDLVPHITSAIEKIRKLDNDHDFVTDSDYSIKRNESDIDTQFIYPLVDEWSKDAARIGVKELVNTLPVTMIFLDKVNEVRIKNDSSGIFETYTCNLVKKEECVFFYEVIRNIEGSDLIKSNFLLWKSEEVQLVCPVSDFEEYKIGIPLGNVPILYRDFPLIGSEKFYFPFFLNGLSFYPTENRDSILIKGIETKPQHNKNLLAKAQVASLAFTDWLIQKDAKNLFVLANTRLPYIADLPDDTKIWFKEFQTKWRTELLDKKLVETEAGNKTIKEIVVPRSDFSTKKDDHHKFFDITLSLIGKDLLPRKDLLENWLEAIGTQEEYKTWTKEIFFTESDLLKKIEAAQNVVSLELKSLDSVSETDKIDWLNLVYSWLSTNRQLEQLSECSVVPNQYGKFKKLGSLWWEKVKDPIPDSVLDILFQLTKDWRDEMIYRPIKFDGLLKVERGLGDASTSINEELSKEEKNKAGLVVSDFLKNPNAQPILVAILSLVTDNSDMSSFRVEVFRYAKQLMHFTNDFCRVGNLQGFSFNVAARLMVRFINQKISLAKNTKSLMASIAKDHDGTIIWLNNYLRFLQNNNEYSYLLKDGNIVPNRLFDLCAFDDLRNFGTDDQPLDEQLIQILKELDSKQDWFPKLVCDGIGIKLKEPLKFEELAKSINLFVNNIYSKNELELYRNQLLSIIEWCNDKSNTDLARKYMNEFVEKSNRIFFILTIEKSEHSGDLVKLMKSPERLADLVAISESGIDIDKIRELINIAQRTGEIEKVLAHARELEEEQRDFDFKLNLGKKIEELFKTALEKSGIDADIEYIGTGSHDFVIRNTVNNREFYLELKSHKISDLVTPIKLATSQAELAVTSPGAFALCVVSRPADIKQVTTGYFENNLKYLKNLQDDFQIAVDRSKQILQIANDSSSVSVEIKDPSCKVKVSHGYIEKFKNPFSILVADIKEALEAN